MTTHVQQTLPFPWQGGRQCSLQLLTQLWICASATHYGWVDPSGVEYEVGLTLLHMTSTGNRTPDLLILHESNALSTTPQCLKAINQHVHAPLLIEYQSVIKK